MKFLCVECDAQMASTGQTDPGDGTLGIVFRCPACEREVAMLTNPMETQMVNSLCVRVGGREDDAETRPFEMLDSQLGPAGMDREAAAERSARDDEPVWNAEAEERLQRVPGFVRGMVRRMYVDWARGREIREITPEVMDRARADLDLEGMVG